MSTSKSTKAASRAKKGSKKEGDIKTKAAATKTHFVRFETLREQKSDPDKLIGEQLCASSSNRNFKGRQGSPTGRRVLMSPVMVAASAVTGEVSDAREVYEVGALV